MIYLFETNENEGYCKTRLGYNIGYENFKVIHTFKFMPSDEMVSKIQKDYSRMRDLTLAGQALSEKILKSDIFGACPGHNFNYNKENPHASDPRSLTKHPTMKHAERKVFQFKGRAVTELIADSLGKQVKKDGAAKGLHVIDFPNFM